jgi:ankyrin repeat protein
MTQEVAVAVRPPAVYMVIAALIGLAACQQQSPPQSLSPATVAANEAAQKCFTSVAPPSAVDAELYAASGVGDVARIQAAITAGGNVNAIDSLARTPLFASAFCNQPESAAALLNKGAAIDARDFTGMSPLHAAIIGEADAVAKLLITSGANINLQNSSGRTALHLAAATDQVAMSTWLLDHGANVQLRDKEGRTAKGLAADNNHRDVVAAIKSWQKIHKVLPRKQG